MALDRSIEVLQDSHLGYEYDDLCTSFRNRRKVQSDSIDIFEIRHRHARRDKVAGMIAPIGFYYLSAPSISFKLQKLAFG